MSKVKKSIAAENANLESNEVKNVIEGNNVNPLGEKVVALNDLKSRLPELNKKSREMDPSKKAKTTKKSDPDKPKVPGVIETIFNSIEKSGEKGVSKAQILARLVQKFPDRDKLGMEKTINVQLPKRMSKERAVKIEKTEKGNFILVK